MAPITPSQQSVPIVKVARRTSGPIACSSKYRPNVEREFKVRQPEKLQRGRRNRRLILSRIELVSEVHSNRAYRRWVPKAETHRMRKIIEIRGGRRFPRQ